MPPKRKAGARGPKEATDSGEEPKSKRVCAAPKAGANKKSRAYKMPPPLPAGEVLSDVTHKLSWSLGESVGKGGFGEIYRASPIGGSKSVQHVIKIEPHENGPLYTEIAFYCRAAKEDMIASWVSSHKLAYLPIPRHVAHGLHCHSGVEYRFLVMDCFGEDVEKKFNQCGRRFGSKTVCHLALRILEALEYLHCSEYAHGDIKGSNLLTGLQPSQHHQVYLVDYGLAYRYKPDGQHKVYKEDPRRKHDGTLEFTSIDAHKGVTPSARGDLEILGYCLLQWWSGCLPWDQQVGKDDKEAVAQMKIRYRSDVVGLMRACFKSTAHPNSLKQYLTYIHSLDYHTTPDYHKARQIFLKELSSLGLRDDGKDIDWTAPRLKSKAHVVSEECDSRDGATLPASKRKRGTKRVQKPAETTQPVAKGEKKPKVSKHLVDAASPGSDNTSSAEEEWVPKKKVNTGRKKRAEITAVEDDGLPDSDSAGLVEEIQVSKKKGPSGGRRGRKRKSPQPEGPAVATVRPIIRRASGGSSVTAGEGLGSVIIPQVSYPAALGYVAGERDSGEDLLEPSSKRSRLAATRKKQPKSQAATSSPSKTLRSLARSKNKSPIKSRAQMKPRTRQKKGSSDHQPDTERT